MQTLLKEILSVNVCKIFVLPPKYFLLHYNLSENGKTDSCFNSKFGKGPSFLFTQKETRTLYPPSSFLGVTELVPGFGCVCAEDSMMSCS